MGLRVVPHPQGLTFTEWADTVVGYNSELLHQLSSDLDWPDFAQRLTLVYPMTPRPELFGDWVNWADALRSALQF